MMIGEFDYNDIFHGTDYVAYWLTYILMTVFIVVMSIIIMNLLVGLAVDDIKGVLDKAALKRMAMQVRHFFLLLLFDYLLWPCQLLSWTNLLVWL